MPARKLYAFLIAIDEYPESVPPLYGCVNDVSAFETYLQTRVASGEFELHLHTLYNQQATRQNVIDGFKNHLTQAGSQDVALFYYSGHGSQEPAPKEFWDIEPDHMNETMVCWDSREPSGSDLADKELAVLISEVGAKGTHFLMIMDCCHSGSGTRDAKQFGAVRQAPADTRLRPIESYLFPKERMLAARLQAEAEEKKGKTSGWQTLPQGKHILFAACQDIQTAKEYHADGKSWGAFSYFLRNTLESANTGLTYRDLFKQAQARVKTSVRDQAPQIEATNASELDQPFLGGAVKPRPAYYTASFNGSDWALDGGAVHGIPAPMGMDTTRLALFPLDTDPAELSDLSKSVGQADVVEVRPDTSVLALYFEADTTKTYKAIVTGLPLPPVGVLLEGDEAGLALVREAFAKDANGQPSLYVQEADRDAARLRLVAKDNELTITRNGDEKLLTSALQGYTAQSAGKARERLEHAARWMRTAELSNPGSNLPADAVSMHFMRGGVELDPQDLLLEYQSLGGKMAPPTFELHVRNNSDQTLYCNVLDLSDSFAVDVMYNKPHVKLDPGQSFADKFGAIVPDDAWKQGVTERQEIFKLVVCTNEFDASLLRQGALDSPFSATRSASKPANALGRLMNRVQTREVVRYEELQEYSDWMTSQAVATVRRPLDTQVIVSQGAAVPVGFGVSLDPHPSLTGRVRVGSQGPATRDLTGVPQPAIFQQATPEIQEFRLAATRSIERNNILELHQINDHKAVTSESPLRLNLMQPMASGEHVLAYGYDGEFFLPLGAARTVNRTTQIEIQRLPEPTNLGVRDLGGAIRIFFQKIISKPLGLKFEYPILAAVTLNPDGTPSYEGDPAQVRQRVAAAKNITLYVHGFIGDTRGMAASAKTTNSDELLLAFDYESINTPVQEIARQLKDRLTAVGLGAGHGKRLRMVVHSLGGVVSRWFIEFEGGKDMVQQLVIVGSPSAGVPWASVQQHATIGLTALLNGLTAGAWPAAVLGGFLTAFEKVDVTLDQLQPGSEVFQALAKAPDPHVPYTLIAGNTSIIAKALEGGSQSKLSRLMTSVGYPLFDLGFFNLPNDFVVGVNSVFAVPAGRTPTPRQVEIACDHVVYFSNPNGLQTLKGVLG
jgi:hypothetical protein